MNSVNLVGRLTSDPQIRYTPNGVAVCNFTLAVNRTFKSEGQPDADFPNIVVWKKQAENAANYLKKGSLAGVTGRVQTRSWDGQDGKKQYATEIVAESVQFLDPKGANTGGEKKQQQTQTRVDEDPFAGNGQINISDDVLPF